jgi:hypothetical protein
MFLLWGQGLFWPVLYTWVVFAAPFCTFRLGCLRSILPKLFKRVYLVSSLIFVITEAVLKNFFFLYLL